MIQGKLLSQTNLQLLHSFETSTHTQSPQVLLLVFWESIVIQENAVSNTWDLCANYIKNTKFNRRKEKADTIYLSIYQFKIV